MKKRINSSCAFIMVLSLLGALIALPASAAAHSGDALPQDLIREAERSDYAASSKDLASDVSYELEVLTDLNVDVSRFSIDYIDAAGEVYYTYKTCWGEDVFLNVDSSASDSVTLHYAEGRHNDTVTFYDDGRIFLNNYEVIHREECCAAQSWILHYEANIPSQRHTGVAIHRLTHAV